MSGEAAERLAAFLAARPYAQFLGMQATFEGRRALSQLPYSEHLIGNPLIPALHGGVVGAFLELAALAELAAHGHPARTVDVTIDYIRPARAVATHAHAQVIRRGRRVANVQATAWQEGPHQPVATLRGHFLLALSER